MSSNLNTMKMPLMVDDAVISSQFLKVLVLSSDNSVSVTISAEGELGKTLIEAFSSGAPAAVQIKPLPVTSHNSKKESI